MTLKSMIPWSRTERQPTVRRGIDSPLSLLQNDMNRLFEEFFGEGPLSAFGMEGFGGRWPQVDWEEKEKEFLLSAELPGVDEKDIEISVHRDLLTIRAVKREEAEKSEGTIHGRERRYGTFQRTLTLGAEVDADRVKATYKNGVLRITLPKKESAVSPVRKIEVKAA